MHNPKTILLVEDEIMIAMGEIQLLEKEGYRVRNALDGQMAFKMACDENEPVDLILMDITLGSGMDGIQVARQILLIRDIPIIFLSSHSDQEVVEKIEPVASYGYVVKGSGAAVLLASIKMAFKLHEAHTKLREAEAKYRDIFENAIVGIFQSTPDGRLLSVNAAMARIFDYASPEEMLQSVGNQVAARLYADPSQRAEFVQVMGTSGSVREFEAQLMRKDRQVIWVKINARSIRDDNGEVLYYEGFMEDITRRKQIEEDLQKTNALLQTQLDQIQALHETLRYEAIRDSLTGLFNRRYLFETLDRELARARREGYTVSVLMIDIDHFKAFNDTYGHQAGDEVLRKLGELFRSQIRQSDIACRYGGEEFIIIMPVAEDGDTLRRADMIRYAFNHMPIVYSDQEIFASISIGIAFYPRHGQDAQTVIKTADDALYESKRLGRNCVYAWK